MSYHRSTAYAPVLGYRDEVSKQLRFVIRLAVACQASGTEYDVEWKMANKPADSPGFYPAPEHRANQFGRMVATITALGAMPATKALPKPPALRLVSDSWTPKQWDAEYKLDAIETAGKLSPAFVIAHSSGLSLTMACGTGEWGTEHGDADPNGKWTLTHTASGKSFGVELPLPRAAKALLFASAQPVDWTVGLDTLKAAPGFIRAGLTVRSEFGCKSDRVESLERLERLAA